MRLVRTQINLRIYSFYTEIAHWEKLVNKFLKNTNAALVRKQEVDCIKNISICEAGIRQILLTIAYHD